MEGAVAHYLATTGVNVPSQMSSTTGFQATPAPNVTPNRPAETTTSEALMECDSTKPSNVNDKATSSNAPEQSATSPAVTNPADQGKTAPGKSRSRSRQKKYRPKGNKAELELRVEVSGYPTFAKPQDLHKVFSKYGFVRVEHVGRKYAVVAFSSKDVAMAALNETMQMCLYGQFLNVKPFTGVLDEQKKQVYKNKHVVPTVAPNQIRLEGTFGEQLAALLAAVRLTQEEVTSLATLYGDLEHVMQPAWPGCQAMPFGSITTGLGVKSSDADCFMNIPPQFRYGSYNFVNKAKRILQQYPELFAEVFAIPRANTPIVKLFHVPTRTYCDLTFKNPLGALNSKLVAFLLHSDPRFLPLAVVVKYWAAVNGLSGSGKLTNYALTLLLIFYLQGRVLLPSVAWLQQGAQPIVVDGWNTAFVEDYSRLPRANEQASIDELLGGFFQYYDGFDFENLVACPYLGRAVDKHHFVASNLPEEFLQYQQNVADNLVAPLRTKVPLCVQDPFEQCHNVSSSVSSRLADNIRSFIHFAAVAYEKDKTTGCQQLLHTILLEKPKLTRAKSNPEYSVNLHPKLLDTIIHDDWKQTVRRTVFTIFEDMLKLTLVPAEESETNPKGRSREKYSTRMTTPVWKRKQFARLYDAMSFIERHARVTEEILNVEQSEWVVDFNVGLSFSAKIRSAWVSIRMTNGCIDAFHHFGKYYLATMQNWVIGVLHAKGDSSTQNNLNTLGAIDKNVVNSDFESDSVGEDKAYEKHNESSEKELQTSTKESDASEKEVEVSKDKGSLKVSQTAFKEESKETTEEDTSNSEQEQLHPLTGEC